MLIQNYFLEILKLIYQKISQDQIMKVLKNFLKIRKQPYSINRIEDIVEKIETITINEQYESIKAMLMKI